jgi:hypothetical protein
MNQQLFSQSESNSMPFTVVPCCLLPFGTVSILMLLMVQKATGEALVNLGEVSEELFRGDRLPMLNFPHDQES